MRDPSTHRVLCPLLIGRTSAVTALRQSIDELFGSVTQVVCISGEPGIGKSRLAAEASAYAAERGVSVQHVHCFPQDRTQPYAPLLAMLRAHFATQPPGKVSVTTAPFARELAALLPEWVSIASEPQPPPAPEQTPHRVFSALAHCLVPPQNHSPVLLIADDLHWCDDSSLETLLYLVRSTSRALVLIGTYRHDEVTDGLQQWLVDVNRVSPVHELNLTRLTRAEVAAMVDAIFGFETPTAGALHEAVYDLAEGNPFYVEELLKALAMAGDLAHTGAAWTSKPLVELHIPRSLQGIVQQRLASLSEDAREVLTLAAVRGRRFDFALLERLAGSDQHELLRRIKELVAAQLVVEEAPDQFAFRHALTQQAIYSDLLSRERRVLHQRVADAIEQFARGAIEAHVADLAHHYFAAEAWAKALAYAGWAGEQAQRLHAPRVAVEQYTRALEAMQRLSQPPSPNTPTQLTLAPVQLYLARGQAYETIGQFEAAQADYATAIDLAQGMDDRPAEWEALLRLGLLWSGRDYARAGAYCQRAVDLARALKEPPLIARSLNRLGNWHVNVGRPQEAARHHQEALVIFEQLQDRSGTAETLDLLGVASYLSADLPSSTAYFERASALFDQLNDPFGLVTSLVMTMTTRAGTLFLDTMTADATRLARARDDGERALELVRRLEWRAGESFALWALGTLLGLYGEYGRALEAAARACQIAEEIGHHQWQASSHWTLGMIYLDLLAAPLARTHLEQALQLAQAIGSTVWMHHAASALAVAYLRDHQRPRAEALLSTVFDPAAPIERSGLLMRCWARARLALARRDPARALHILDLAHLRELHTPPQLETLRLARLRGETLAALGRTDEAESILSAVRGGVEVQGARSQLWRCHLALGGVYHVQQRPDDAQRAFTAAQNAITELAATIPDQALRDSFAQQAVEQIPRRYLPSSRRAQAARFDGLTARERDVAALIGHGKSNREIADVLVIGERTVETHVSNIFAKLNVNARDAVAAWALAKGLI